MNEDTNEIKNNVNDIIQHDNFDEKNDKTKQPSDIHPVVKSRLDREKSSFSEETTIINEPIPEGANALESNTVTRADLKNLENRVAATVEQINLQFDQISKNLNLLAAEVRALSEKDKTYKNAFISLENRFSAILRNLNSK